MPPYAYITLPYVLSMTVSLVTIQPLFWIDGALVYQVTPCFSEPYTAFLDPRGIGIELRT